MMIECYWWSLGTSGVVRDSESLNSETYENFEFLLEDISLVQYVLVISWQ